MAKTETHGGPALSIWAHKKCVTFDYTSTGHGVPTVNISMSQELPGGSGAPHVDFSRGFTNINIQLTTAELLVLVACVMGKRLQASFKRPQAAVSFEWQFREGGGAHVFCLGKASHQVIAVPVAAERLIELALFLVTRVSHAYPQSPPELIRLALEAGVPGGRDGPVDSGEK